MDTLEMVLLYDYYGDLLTDRQKECFEMRYYQDLSLGEIAAELGISRQGVHDNLSRTEALLRNMEAKTGCAGRDQACRKAAKAILGAARQLAVSADISVSNLAQQIIDAARDLEE
ncbi:MAG: DNA-binding protein [Ruminococcaceae bacterium]|nr:DNA-binding protein [Oscillospiraceae bacterium]